MDGTFIIPLRQKYRHASTKSMRSTNSTSGSSKKNRRKGTTQVTTRTRMLVLVDGRRRSWTWV